MDISSGEDLRAYLANLSMVKSLDPLADGIHVRSGQNWTPRNHFKVNTRAAEYLVSTHNHRSSFNPAVPGKPCRNLLYDCSSFHHPRAPLAAVLRDGYLEILIKSSRLYKHEIEFYPPQHRTCDGFDFEYGFPPLRGKISANNNICRDWEAVYEGAISYGHANNSDICPPLMTEFRTMHPSNRTVCNCHK